MMRMRWRNDQIGFLVHDVRYHPFFDRFTSSKEYAMPAVAALATVALVSAIAASPAFCIARACRGGVSVAPQVTKPPVPWPIVSVSTGPLIVASAGVSDGRFVDVFVPIHFATARPSAAGQMVFRTAVQRCKRVFQMGHSVDLASRFFHANILRTFGS